MTTAPSIPVRLKNVVTSLIGRGFAGLVSLVRSLIGQGESWLLDGKHAQYGLAVTRMLLGATVLGMLLTNWSTRLYTFASGASWTGQHGSPTSEFASIWPVNIMVEAATNDTLFTTLYVILGIAAVSFIVGYRTRISLVVMFILWVGLVEVNELVSDQSDNLTRMVMLAMFFTACADRWSFDARRRERFAGTGGNVLVRWSRFQPVLPAWSTSLAQNLAIIVMATHVFFIYVSGAMYKSGGDPWSGGWAIYDPIHTVQFGPWPELSALVTAWGPGVAAMTAVTLLVQLGFPLMLMRRGTRIVALIVVLGFHLGIAVLMGLPWFSLSMIAIDAIFIRDITWKAMAGGLTKTWRSTSGKAQPTVAATPAAELDAPETESATTESERQPALIAAS
ncbi:HTTM domain-containing protein [Plantibacter sp. Mn2098]|uniref:HTTM domain-containing protein n=1 Tax=Plantibacter sp. Mn2098 TaxID=3395266 RepID=UPI003BC09BC4